MIRWTILFTCFSSLLLPAAELVDFGSKEGGVATAPVNKAKAALAEVSFSEDAMQLKAPDAYSANLMFQNLNLSGSLLEGKTELGIRLKGVAGGDSPSLKLVLFSSDWSKQAVYKVQIQGLGAATDFVELSAGKIAEPVSGTPFGPLENIGHVMLITGCKAMKAPWDLEVDHLWLR